MSTAPLQGHSIQEEARMDALKRFHEARREYFEAIQAEDVAATLAEEAGGALDTERRFIQARDRKRTARAGFVKATVEARVQGIDVASVLAPDV